VSGDGFCVASSSILLVRDRRSDLDMVSKPPPPPIPFVPPDAPIPNRLPMSPRALNGLTVVAPVPASPLGLPINEPSILNADGVDDDDDNCVPPLVVRFATTTTTPSSSSAVGVDAISCTTCMSGVVPTVGYCSTGGVVDVV